MLNSSLVFQLDFGVKLSICALIFATSPSQESLAVIKNKSDTSKFENQPT